ncbi:MAG: SdrD B-like domain-containing protein [Bacteroidota bacterium]|nr:SdrD B-like domain-containing protein [Bacteroidota bacterium]
MKTYSTLLKIFITKGREHFINILYFVLASILLSTHSQASYQEQTNSLRERAMKANQQLRDYKQRIANEAKKENLYKQSSSPNKVGIQIDLNYKTSSNIIFYDNMEGGIGGWTTVAYSNSDIWHQTNLNSSSPSTSWWIGIEQQENYDNGTRINNALISPPINLSGTVGTINLLFTENYTTELGWDYCMVDVTTDGGANWSHLRGGYGAAPSGTSDGWIITTLDLNAYAGRMVQIRFYFDTGDQLFNEFPGWFVDDVIIFDQSGTITGKKFFDVNNNSIKDIGERGVKDWLITATGQGISLTTRTNYRGKYWLPLPLGSYTLTETPKPNWVQTYPQSGQWNINLATPDTLVDSIHFGNYTHASFINGVKFYDLNRSGTYDGGDTLIGEWKILLTDTLGNFIDYDRTDSLGQYQLYVYEPGMYIVMENTKKGWVQTYPAEEFYTIGIPDLFSTVDGKDFGNYYDPTVNGILGQKFHDRNRNRIRDQNEECLAGFKIRLYRQGSGGKYSLYKKSKTDSSGYYQFLNIPEGIFKVSETPLLGWYQSYPESCYMLTMIPDGKFDTLDFGNYQIESSSIAGMKFNDINGNGVKDAGEPGLNNWTIILSGFTIYETTTNIANITDSDGNYGFTGIWPGKYSVSEVWKPYWRQTLPTYFRPYFVNLGAESHLGDINFGNTSDSNFTLTFRTFLPDSLALAVDQKNKHNLIKPKPDKTEFTITLHNDHSLPAHGLIVHTSKSMIPSTLTCSKPGAIEFLDAKLKRIKITFIEYVQPGDSVVLHGYSRKIGVQHASTQKWLIAGGGVYVGHLQTFTNEYWLPMPNAINFLAAGAGTNLKVGVGGPHSVVHPNYKHVQKSLVEKNDRMHIGVARCLDKFSNNKSIRNEQKSLPPTKHNNKLFAEVIALRANILGSDYGITPAGFGNLIFDEGGTNPMNNSPIRTIADMLDIYMSSYKDTAQNPQCTMPPLFAGMDPETLWTKIRKINGAFSGPMDTVSFGAILELKGVKLLDEVPFLRLDSVALSMGNVPIFPVPTAIPEQFTLNQNYPNPFNPSTIIEFYLPQASIVTLKIYNTLGQEVATLLDRQEMEDGAQEVEFSSVNAQLSSGIYFYRIVAESVKDEDNPVGQKYVKIKKMLLLK